MARYETKLGGIHLRIGHGYDVHKLVPERKLILGGVEIPYEKGLLGHSDADVLTHAIMDALLGAAGLGDIGGMFPDDDLTYEGISSLILLRRVMRRLADKGLCVGNLDVTLIVQRPKLGDFLPEMKHVLAHAMEVEETCINLKATTEEGLGFTGAGAGIAVHAVCLLEKK